MDDLDVLNLMADIETRRESMRETMRRIERWQNLMIGLVAILCGAILIGGIFR